jgi:predicted amidohydrolase
MYMKKAKIGLIQVHPETDGTVEARHEHLLDLAERCLKDGADLVFMPEAFQYVGVLQTADKRTLVEKYAGVYKEKCAELAKKYSAYVVPWDYELKDDKLYNVSYILDRQGNETGRYRKVHLTQEGLANLTHGYEFPVFDLDIGKVGIMICFDNYFPESARILALNGAELILYPLYGDTLKPQWEIKARARAIDNSVYVAPCQITSALSDDFAGVAFTGMIDPEGEIICKLTEKGSYKVIEIEMGKRVVTHTSGILSKSEYIKEYLLNTANVEAYRPIIEKRPSTPWDEVLF